MPSVEACKNQAVQQEGSTRPTQETGRFEEDERSSNGCRPQVWERRALGRQLRTINPSSFSGQKYGFHRPRSI
jgi:hypothetical protein